MLSNQRGAHERGRVVGGQGRNCGYLATKGKAVPSNEFGGESEEWRGSPGGSVGV